MHHHHHDVETPAGVTHVIKCDQPHGRAGKAHTHVVACSTAGAAVGPADARWFAAARDRWTHLRVVAVNAVCEQCMKLRRLASVDKAKPAAYLNLLADIMVRGLMLGLACSS